MPRKCEMKIGNRMIAGTYDEAKDNALNVYRWRFPFKNEREHGAHVFGGFASKSDCLERAKRMGVEFNNESEEK